MRILIAPDSYKESLTSLEVATAISKGFQEIFPHAEYLLLPVADGGEGTKEAIIDTTNGEYISVQVMDPLGHLTKAKYGITGNKKTAVIEMAAASGLMLVPEKERNPLITTSFGTGELIIDALNRGVEHIILGIGGSATNDGGVGMLQALGVEFKDENDNEISLGGKFLKNIRTINIDNLHPRVKSCYFEIACDVENTLTGHSGASYIFGPQKGATPDMVKELDAALMNYANKIQEQLNINVHSLKGGGAAGGMGVATYAFLGGEMKSGIDIVLDVLNLNNLVKDVDLVITGEGRIDGQTIHGKAPIGVAKIAKRYNKPVIAIAGSLGKDFELAYDHGLDAIFSIMNRPCSLEEAYLSSVTNLYNTARNIAATLKVSY